MRIGGNADALSRRVNTHGSGMSQPLIQNILATSRFTLRPLRPLPKRALFLLRTKGAQRYSRICGIFFALTREISLATMR